MIALLGATGTIGRPLAGLLAERGMPARALVRDPKAADLPVPAVRADLRDEGSLADALKGCDRLFLLTPHGPEQDLWEARAVRAARRAGVTGIVKLSGGAASLSADGPTATAVAHWRTEGLIEELGFDFVHLRPSFLAQNLLETVAPIVRKARLVVGPFADEPITMVDARDVAACAAAILERLTLDGTAWSLTGPVATTHRAIAATLGVRLLRFPVPLVARALARQGKNPWEVDHALRMVAYLQTGADGTTSDAVERLTGTAPRSIERFLDDHAEAFHHPARRDHHLTRPVGASAGTTSRSSTS